MAVPKSRTSKAKRDRRRSHDHLAAPSLSKCPECEAPKLPHRVCPSCGSYKGRVVVEIDDE
ncbi:MAG: 50S ribosomal protein L32 [Myxococcota bacterium]|nr:50S ribosomal protein L32 [Myxococcota bacterium]